MSSHRSRRWRWVKRFADWFDVYIFPKSIVGQYGEINWSKYVVAGRYEKVQIAASMAKYALSWAKEDSCKAIVEILRSEGVSPRSILCHGVRNGSELKFFSEAGVDEVLGTDLYVPKDQTYFGTVVQHNFSEPELNWLGKFEYVYSNSLDHALNPIETLMIWAEQIEESGSILLELDKTHGVGGTSDLDVSGIPLNILPFWLSRESGNRLFVKTIHDLPSQRLLFQIKKHHGPSV